MKGPRAQSYHGIVVEGGGGIDRGTTASPKLAIKREKTISY